MGSSKNLFMTKNILGEGTPKHTFEHGHAAVCGEMGAFLRCFDGYFTHSGDITLFLQLIFKDLIGSVVLFTDWSYPI